MFPRPLPLLLLLVACGPDLPAGWEDARRVDSLEQTDCAGSPLEGYEVAISAERSSDALRVGYSNAHFRCEQEVEGFWREGASGPEILVQPKDMHPSAVAGCDCLYEVTMTLPVSGTGAVEVFRRWDAINDPNEPVRVGDATF